MPERLTDSDTQAPKGKIDLPPGRYGNTEACPCIDLYAVAEAVYKLMKKDLRLERERLGRR